MKHSVAFYFMLFLQSSSWAQDYLEPENPAYFDSQLDYHVMVGKVLTRELPYNFPKVIVMPSNQRESIVGLAPEASGCAVVFGRADLLLWRYAIASSQSERKQREILRDYPRDPLDISVTVQRRNTSGVLCDRIAKIWELVLLQTQYERSCQPSQLCQTVTDGVSYHFSTWVAGRGMLAGQARNPNSESLPGRLVNLVSTMRRYTDSDLEIGPNELEQALKRVEEELGRLP